MQYLLNEILFGFICVNESYLKCTVLYFVKYYKFFNIVLNKLRKYLIEIWASSFGWKEYWEVVGVPDSSPPVVFMQYKDKQEKARKCMPVTSVLIAFQQTRTFALMYVSCCK